MLLPFERLRPAILGAMDVTQNADGSACLHRFTEAQRILYDPKGSRIFSTHHAANITLDFWTDSDSITLTFSGRCRDKRAYIRTDLLENGILTQSYHVDRVHSDLSAPVGYGPITATFSLSPGEKRVTVYFCYGTSVESLTVSLPEGAAFRPYRPKRTMLSFGGSITYGSIAQFPSMTYISQLARLLDAEVHNFGIGGEKFQGEKIVPGTYPACDLITVAYGGNDYGHKDSSPEVFFREMPEFFRRLSVQFPQTPVFVLLPFRKRKDEPRKLGTMEQVQQYIRQEASQYPNCHIIDSSGFVPQLPEFYADITTHPNDLGMTHYANNLYYAICKELPTLCL